MAETVKRYSVEIGDRPDYFKYRQKESEKHRFFDLFYPNQDNMLLKTAHCAAIGGWAGLIKGFVEVTAIEPVLSWKSSKAWTIFFRHWTPWLLGGGAYGLTTAFSYQIRKKEDYVNHSFGGAASGLAYGAWYKKGHVAIWAAIGMSVTCGVLYNQCMVWSRPGTQWTKLENAPASFNRGRSGMFCEIPPGDKDGNKETKLQYYTP